MPTKNGIAENSVDYWHTRMFRHHLKDLAVALAVSLPSPKENEWDVLAPWIKSQLEVLSSGKLHPDKFVSLVWNYFFLFAVLVSDCGP